MKITKQQLKKLILQEMIEDNDEMFGKTMAGFGGDGFGADPVDGSALDNVRRSLSEIQDAKKDLKSNQLASLEYTLNYIEEMLTKAMEELTQ